jgi:hypothetical protein
MENNNNLKIDLSSAIDRARDIVLFLSLPAFLTGLAAAGAVAVIMLYALTVMSVVGAAELVQFILDNI